MENLRLARKYVNIKCLCFLSVLFLISCTEPVAPDFQFKDGFIFIDGLISSLPNASYVTVSESKFIFGIYKNEFIENADVVIKNLETGQEITLIEEEERYVPIADFALEKGESWELHVGLQDGRQYRSSPETVSDAVPISGLDATYAPKLKFSVSNDKFVPGHTVAVTFKDPPQEDNFYYWRFRSYEKDFICQLCFTSLFRNGECINELNFTFGRYLGNVLYFCPADCWRIRYGQNVVVFSDRFSNGKTIQSLPIADVLLYTNEDILVAIEQYSISSEAHRYYTALKDIIDDNGSFNAAPPATLLGNIFNIENSDEYVLGRFTVANASTSSIFIERKSIVESAIGPKIYGKTEEEAILPEFKLLNPPINVAPCNEGRFRTGIQPEGWNQ